MLQRNHLQRAGFDVVCSYPKPHSHKLFTAHLYLDPEKIVRIAGISNSNEEAGHFRPLLKKKKIIKLQGALRHSLFRAVTVYFPQF